MNKVMQFLRDPAALVSLSAFMATFVAPVMADDQRLRLRRASIGAIAGIAIGGLAAIVEQEPNLLLISVFGAAAGALLAGLSTYLLGWNK